MDLSTDIIYLRKQDIFEVYETLSPTPHYEYTRTTVSSPPPTPPPPPPPPPTPFLLISTSLDPEPHRISGLPQYHHPPRSMPIYNVLTGGSTTYSATPPSTLMCFVSQKQFKTIPRSLLYLTDPSLAVSDRSVSLSVGAYGWICSLPHGQPLATNQGPIFGSLPSSFRAKAYGLLSYLQFLYCISQYIHSPLPKETILYTDSASLIAKIREIEKWLYFFPNTTTGTFFNK